MSESALTRLTAAAGRGRDRLITAIVFGALCLSKPGATWRFIRALHRLPALSVPRRVNDKHHWRKLVDHNPDFVIFNDKLAAKDWVRSRLPDLKIPRTIWTGARAEDLPFDRLDRPLMVKANHGCNFNLLFDGERPGRARIVRQANRWLARTYGTKIGEWAYSEIAPRLFVEELIRGPDDALPAMINVHVFGGEVAYAGLYLGPKTGERFLSFFDQDGTRLAFDLISPQMPVPADWPLPASFQSAVEAARILGRGQDYVRCDFLATEQDIWFSEITTYVASGRALFLNPKAAEARHAGWDLRKSWFMRAEHRGWRRVYQSALRRLLEATS